MPKPTPAQHDQILNTENISLQDIAAAAHLSSIPVDFSSFHLPIYLDPDQIIDGENVRPGETDDEHEQRVKDLIRSIRADGQQLPIKVREVRDNIGRGSFQVVDGQGRLDALRIINRYRKSSGSAEPLLSAWCVLDSGSDPWATAVKLNVQRANYTDLQVAELISQARQRYGWTTKGGGKKLAHLFGISEQLLVEYNTLADAPADVKARLQSGELSKSGALKLIKSAENIIEPAKAVVRREQVAAKAKEIAAKDKAAKEAGAKRQIPEPKGTKAPKHQHQFTEITRKGNLDAAAVTRLSAPARPVKVEAQHIAQAAREVAESVGERPAAVRRNRTEIIAAVQSLMEFSPIYAHTGREFLESILKFAEGSHSPKQLQNRWNTLLHITAKPAKAKSAGAQ